jgi:hypothetical protein
MQNVTIPPLFSEFLHSQTDIGKYFFYFSFCKNKYKNNNNIIYLFKIIITSLIFLFK